MTEPLKVIPMAELNRLFICDPERGTLRWRVSPSIRMKAGSMAGYEIHGYRYVRVKGYGAVAVHRVVFAMASGGWPIGPVDHINGERGDNRIQNLRESNRSENAQNQRRAHKGSQTGYLGVSYFDGAFTAQIRCSGKQKHLGRFPTAELAHEAYLKAKRELHPGAIL